MKQKKYYVYVHRRASDGTIFYVGKGSGRRSHHEHNRSLHWKNIVSKNGFYVEIVKMFESEVCAFTFEMVLIKHIGMQNLCNISTGGYGGATGSKRSESHRAAISKAQSGKFVSIETREKISKSGMGRTSHNKGKTYKTNIPSKSCKAVIRSDGLCFSSLLLSAKSISSDEKRWTTIITAISRTANGRSKTAYGFKWSFT